MKNIKSKVSVASLLVSSLKIAPWYLSLATVCIIIKGLTPAVQLKLTQILVDKIYAVFSVGYTSEWLNTFLPILALQLTLFILNVFTTSFKQNLMELAGRKIRIVNQEKLTRVVSKCPVDLFESSAFYDQYKNASNNIMAIESTYGDFNYDGKVNTIDLTIMRKYLAGYDVEFDTAAADFNGDGKVSTVDLTTLRKYLAGYDVVLDGNSQKMKSIYKAKAFSVGVGELLLRSLFAIGSRH